MASISRPPLTTCGASSALFKADSFLADLQKPASGIRLTLKNPSLSDDSLVCRIVRHPDDIDAMLGLIELLALQIIALRLHG